MMNDMVDVVREMVEADTLCGFGHCRAPLPAPGPRGGRPFAYCPDRTWPGGKTCKQLAAAQDALTEALGTPANAAITAATSMFTSAADRVVGPLGEVLAAATGLRDTLAAELTSAAIRVAEAEETAAQERGLRQSAEDAAAAAAAEIQRATDDAAEVARTATAEAQRCQTERDQAVAAADAAETARADAERAQARAEGVAAAERERADQAVREERAHAKALATATEKLAVTRAERDAGRSALEDLRATAEQRQRAADDATAELRARVEDLAGELTEARGRVAEVTDELATTRGRKVEVAAELASARGREAELSAELADARRRLADVDDNREAVTRLTAAERDLARLRATTSALRDVLLTPNLAADDLRTHLLAELLDRTS